MHTHRIKPEEVMGPDWLSEFVLIAGVLLGILGFLFLGFHAIGLG
jgi:hypothetical protein